MTDRNIVFERISLIREYLSFLRDVQSKSEAEYISSPYIYGSAERFLHLAIESALDIGNHVIADMKLRKPQEYKDIFVVLKESGVLSKELSDNLSKMAGFRNILVHGYLKLNRSMVYHFTQINLNDLEQYIEAIINILDT